MDKNDYGYQPEKNMILAMYDKDLLTYEGQVPTIVGSCVMDFAQYPDKAKSSLFTSDQGRLLYDVSPIGASDFTLDFWMRYQSIYSGVSMGEALNGYDKAAKGAVITQDSAWIGSYSDARVVVGWNKTFPAMRWAHYSLVRQNNNLYQFIDGELVASVGNGQMNLNSSRIIINGSYLNAYFGVKCNYKAVRLCDFARWTSDFTPPIPILNRDQTLYLQNNTVYGIQ